MYDLADIQTKIESVKEDPIYRSLLGYYDLSSGVTPIVKKLPINLQEKWTNTAVRYMDEYKIANPPFEVFVNFIRKLSKTKNNSIFMYDSHPVDRTGRETKF